MMFSYSLSLPLLSFQRRYITLASTFAGLQFSKNYLINLFSYGSSLGSNPNISQKYKIGDMSKGVAS
jgi:hypothetical protein